MVVSMLSVLFEITDVESIKDKRRVVHSLRDRIIRKYHVSAAEVDLLDSPTFSQMGVAVVSNSKQHGERVMQRVLQFIEDELPGRVQDVAIHSEWYG